jgi:hypothetical protein
VSGLLTLVECVWLSVFGWGTGMCLLACQPAVVSRFRSIRRQDNRFGVLDVD